MRIKTGLLIISVAVVCLFCAAAIAAPPTYTISGLVQTAAGTGVEGVNVLGNNGASTTVTGADGGYSITVPNKWDGTITVSKSGWLLTPPSKTYTNVSADIPNENYTAYQPKISGLVTKSDGTPLEGATITANNSGGTAITNATGYYELFVPYNWSGTLSASLSGYNFTARNLINVTTDQVNQDFSGFQPKISGYVRNAGGMGLSGAIVTANNGGGSVPTDANGCYELYVPYQWSGTLSASLIWYGFVEKNYVDIVTDQTDQNFSGYQPTISGLVTRQDGTGLEGVIVTANNGGSTAITDSAGNYNLTIPYGRSVEVNPSNPQYTFTPAYNLYFNVRTDIASENYTAKLVWSDNGEQSPWIERQKKLGGGFSVSISGDYAVIGRQGYNNVKGTASLIKRNGTSWGPQQVLSPSDGTLGDYFSHSVAISGDYVVVGAWGLNNCKGAAYIFKRDGTNWVQQKKLTASDGIANDNFGISVSISGDYVIVGSSLIYREGAAYIFKRDGTNWVQHQKLTASNGIANEHFGNSVSINGDYVIIGAKKNWASIESAYIFKFDGTNWIEQKELFASDGAPHDGFGHFLAINSDYAILGAPYDDDKGGHTGSAYVFRRDGTNWVQQQKILASDASIMMNFGSSVAIDGDRIIIGANSGKGSAYIFKQDGTSWREQQKLNISSNSYQDEFGTSVSICGDYTIIGAPGDDDSGTNSGCVYIFSPALILKMLNGGENLVAGSSCDICWDAASTVENIFIAYSVDNGGSWTSIDTVSNTGSYWWAVPDVNSNQCLVGISNADDPIHNDVSSNTFRIYPCTLTCDTNHDCFVNLDDFQRLASEWPQDGTEDLQNLMNFVSEWLQCGDPADPNCQ